MKFEVYDRKEKEEEETVYFDLEKDGLGITLRQVAKDGSEIAGNNIVRITLDGKLKRCDMCSAKGIRTDSDGQILLED